MTSPQKTPPREGEGLRPSEVLERAAALIEPEGAWTQGTWARDGRGDNDPIEGAVCWCAWGAIYQTSGCKWAPEANAGMHFLARSLRLSRGDVMGSIGLWNDFADRTQAEVVTALRKAAELARSEGQ